MPTCDPLLLVDIHHSGYYGWGVWRAADVAERWTAETVERLMRHSSYKMGLNLGAQTYENSPRLAARIREWMQLFPGRIYLAGGDYGQTTACVRSGESNIRQLTVGLETIQQTLGERPTVWSMSEPGNFAQLPQLLCDLGYRGALLRIHGPGQGGSPTTIADAGVVAWEGPDGSVLTAIPEYAGDRERVEDDCPSGMWIMTRYRNDRAARGSYTLDDLLAWRDRMAASGIDPVVLSKDDDHNDQPANANWCMRAGHRLAADTEGDPRFRWVSLDELFDTLPEPQVRYAPPPELFETRKRCFCNYGHTGNRDWATDLDTDASILTAEFASTLAAACEHADASDDEALDQAWRLHLGAQNHDLSLVGSQILMYHLQYEAARYANGVRDRALRAISRDIEASGEYGAVVAFNPAGIDRCDYATITLPAAVAAQAVLTDDAGTVPWEVVERSAELTTMGFVARIPSLGWKAYQLRAGGSPATAARTRVDGRTVHNGAYSVTFGQDGGIEAISAAGDPVSLVEAGMGLVGDIAGASTRSRGEVEIDASGPLSVHVRERGRLSEFHGYAIDYRITPGLPTLHLTIGVQADHFSATPGAPGSAGDPGRKLEYSLRTPASRGAMQCHREQSMLISAYDPSLSPIFAAPGWVDHGGASGGLTILNRGAIGHRWLPEQRELNVILACGDISEFRAEIGLLPHTGDWRSSEAHRQGQLFGLPIRCTYEPSHPGARAATGSLAAVEPANVTVSAAFRKNGASYIRIWEHAGEHADVQFTRGGRTIAAQRVSLELAEREGGAHLTPRQIATFRLDD